MTLMYDQTAILRIELPITIRVAQRQDLALLEWHGQFTHFRQLFKRSYDEQQRGNRLMLLAISNDYPVARLFIQFNSSNQDMADGHTRAYLFSFYVMEMLRGRGIGKRLMAHAEDLLIQRGYQQARIAVAKNNMRALRLYEHLNYLIYAEDSGRWRYYDHQNRLNEVSEPCWLLQKQL